MPAEWAPHAATWLAWPHYRGDWPGKFEPIPWVYAEIIRSLSKGRLSPHGSLALKFRFNAWAKYSNWRHDERIGSLMAKAAGFGEIRPLAAGNKIVLEGGSIDVNGAGTILATEECLLSKVQERNPHMTRVHYEKAFADYLGAPHTIWLGRGILGDDTHGHVDDLTRFVSKNTVITM